MEDYRHEQNKAGLVFDLDDPNLSSMDEVPGSGGGQYDMITPILRGYMNYSKERNALSSIEEADEEEGEEIQQAETERGLLGEIYFPEEEEDA